MSLIEVEQLQKRFKVKQRHTGRFAALRGLVSGAGLAAGRLRDPEATA